jgi:hypothetical protein
MAKYHVGKFNVSPHALGGNGGLYPDILVYCYLYNSAACYEIQGTDFKFVPW